LLSEPQLDRRVPVVRSLVQTIVLYTNPRTTKYIEYGFEGYIVTI